MKKEISNKYITRAESPHSNRQYEEGKSSSRWRGAFQKDRDRIIYSRAFRRLMHKTQVFIRPKGDHFRTRLTHTLEVAVIARSIARAIGVDEDLSEAIALAHDLGHPPFGHAGEAQLHNLMRKDGENPSGFDHNVQTLRIVTKLELIGHNFDGLNLTAATLEGLLKHHGVVERDEKDDEKKLSCFFPIIKKIMPSFDFSKPASLEAQCACIADEIAYNHHDLEDGLRAELITLEQVCDSVPHIKEGYDAINNSKRLNDLRHERRLISDLISASVEDIITTTIQQMEDDSFTNECVSFSREQDEKNKKLKFFLHKHLYERTEVESERMKAQEIIKCLFTTLSQPENMHHWDRKSRELYISTPHKNKKRRVLADYIAGMTDNFATRLAEKLNASKN